MIKLMCNIESERTVVLTFRGRVVLKNKSLLEIRDDEINHPEIAFLLKRGVLVSADENKKIEPKEIKEKSIFRCTLPADKLLALDSIKGSIWGGKCIEIKTRDLSNLDVEDSIKRGHIIEVVPRVEVKEETEVEEETEIKEEIKVEETEVEESNLKDINIKEIKESEQEKTEQPKFRVNENVKSVLDSIGKEIYEENEPRKTKKKISKKDKNNE